MGCVGVSPISYSGTCPIAEECQLCVKWVGGRFRVDAKQGIAPSRFGIRTDRFLLPAPIPTCGGLISLPARAKTRPAYGPTSGGFRLADKLCDDGSEGKQGYQRDDAERDRAINAPDAENIGFDVGEIERESEAGKRQNYEEAVPAQKGERAHEDVSGHAERGDGDLEVQWPVVGVMGKHGVWAVVDDAAIPMGIDVAGGIARFAVMLAQGERRSDETEYGQNQ